MAKKNNFRKPVDRLFLGATLLLIIFGLIAVSSASTVLSYERFGHNNYYFFRQIIFAALGIVVLFLTSRIDYHFWKKWSRPLLVMGLVLLALVLVPSLGYEPRTARSWFKIGSLLFQPSEFVKLAIIFYLASWFERKKEAERNFWFGILPPLLTSSAAIGLIVLEPDIGSAAMVGLILIAIFFAANIKWQYLGGLLLAGAGGLWLVIKAAPYRTARIVTFLDPSLDPRGIGYHISQALLAIGAGGLWGYGFGASRQKYSYLPEPIGDSIFAVMAEELGFIRIALLVLLFGFLAIRGLAIANRAQDKFGQLTAIGVTAWITLQAMINIGSITGFLPLTGLTLPLISYGGSSMLALCAGIGVLLNISKQRI